MSLSVKIDWDELRELDFGDFTDSVFVPIGLKLEHPAISVQVTNNTDRTVYISNNGINAKWLLPSKGYMILDIQGNRGIGEAAAAPAGTRFYTKSKTTVPTVGEIVVSIMYLDRN